MAAKSHPSGCCCHCHTSLFREEISGPYPTTINRSMPFKYFNVHPAPRQARERYSRAQRIVKDIPRPDKGMNAFQRYCFLSHRGYRLQSWSKSEKVKWLATKADIQTTWNCEEQQFHAISTVRTCMSCHGHFPKTAVSTLKISLCKTRPWHGRRLHENLGPYTTANNRTNQLSTRFKMIQNRCLC